MLRITGKADVPTYQKTKATQSILSTLNEPPGLLIGEQNSLAVTSMFSDQNKANQQPSSTVKNLQASSLLEVPSTLNRPSGLFIGERNDEHQPGRPQQTTNVFATQRGSHESSKTNDRSARDIASEQFPALIVQEQRVIINESFNKESFYKERSNNRETYSEVVVREDEKKRV